MDWVEVAIVTAKFLFTMVFILQILPLLIWGERKGAAYVQDRPGPNRAYIPLPHLGHLLRGKWKTWAHIRAGGLVHTLPDVVKLITKEDIIPDHVNKVFWAAAPVIAMTVALITMVVVPWGDYLQIGDRYIQLQASQLDGGVLYVLAMTSLAVYAIMLAGWSSNNKFSLLGGLRSSAQMVSYELAMGISVATMFLFYGTTRLDQIVVSQQGPLMIAGSPMVLLPNWGVLSVPGFIAFMLFWVAAFAECNRTPFDLPEGEAELVAGYHTEYSSLRFALFFMAEYANMIVASAVTATLFFGGYSLPFVTGEMLRDNADHVLKIVGVAGAVAFSVFAAIAYNRRNSKFNRQVLQDNPSDPRLNEWKVFVGLWALVALAHVGLFGLGMTWTPSPGHLIGELVAFAAHMNFFALKVLFGCWVFIWARWTLPRFRYDQLMNLGWRYLLPISAVNVLIAGAWIALTANASAG